MSEQVARALYCERIRDPDYDFDADPRGWHQGMHLSAARAALEAMRDADLDVLRAGYEAMFVDKWDGTQAPMMGAGLEAMIDAMLADGADGEDEQA